MHLLSSPALKFCKRTPVPAEGFCDPLVDRSGCGSLRLNWIGGRAHRGCRAAFGVLFLLCASMGAVGAEAQPAAGAVEGSKVQAHLCVFPEEWASRIPPTGSVNYPEFLTTLYPGQKVSIGVMATGIGHDSYLSTAVLRVRFSVGPKVETKEGLKPVALRRIRAQGADFVLVALDAAGISAEERAETAAAMAQQTLAVFATDWEVPSVEQPVDAEVFVDVAGVAPPVALEPVKLRIKPNADWLKESLPSLEQFGQRMNRYQTDLSPGELLAWFTSAAERDSLRLESIQAFFVLRFRSNPEARGAAVAAYPSLTAKTQSALLWILRLAGYELNALFPQLPGDALAKFTPIEPMPDPRALPRFKDPVDVQAVGQLGHAMDRCWAGWMAAGDPSYLRALVELLGGAPDYPAYKAWQEKRGGAKGLNARVARGLAYQIAGWSIGSFQRTDPRVADWLAYWQNDPEVPAVVRQEIAKLPSNPVFRPDQPRQK
jgi:hypothetical protein